MPCFFLKISKKQGKIQSKKIKKYEKKIDNMLIKIKKLEDKKNKKKEKLFCEA